jgi:hypothetical protein
MRTLRYMLGVRARQSTFRGLHRNLDQQDNETGNETRSYHSAAKGRNQKQIPRSAALRSE